MGATTRRADREQHEDCREECHPDEERVDEHADRETQGQRVGWWLEPPGMNAMKTLTS